MSTRVVSDEVWAALDMRAGRLTQRDRRRLCAAGTAAVVLMALAAWGFTSGLLIARIGVQVPQATLHSADRDLTLAVRLTNDGTLAEQVTRVSPDAAVLGVVSGDRMPLSLPAHGARTIRLTVHVNDCSTMRRDQPVRFSVTTAHWWGGFTRSISVIGAVQDAAADVCA